MSLKSRIEALILQISNAKTSLRSALSNKGVSGLKKSLVINNNIIIKAWDKNILGLSCKSPQTNKHKMKNKNPNVIKHKG